MKLIKCSRIRGKPKHRIEVCYERKERALVSPNTKANDCDILMLFMEQCLDCDPTEMKTVEFDTSGYIPPTVVHKKSSSPRPKKTKESVMGKKYVCSKCKEKTDNPNQFILEQGVCRKCYMKDYYKNHPRKNAPKVAPENKKPSVEEALIPAEELEELMAGVDFLDIPIMDLTLREVVQVGGEVRITEKPHVSGIGLATATNSLKVELDFSKYPELHAKLCEMATEDFRVVSMEIMALLDHMVGGSNE